MYRSVFTLAFCLLLPSAWAQSQPTPPAVTGEVPTAPAPQVISAPQAASAPSITPPPSAAPTPPPVLLPPQPSPAPAPAKAPAVREPIAGYTGGNFFIRDPGNWFVLFPKARAHFDYYNFPNKGALPAGVEANSSGDKRPRDGFAIRRARVGVQGTFARHFDYQVEGEFGTAPGLGQYGTVADALINIDYSPYIKIQGGHFNVPFTLENRTSNRIIDFLERSVVVRSFAVPQNKDLGAMIWGWLPKNVAYYSVGVFNGGLVQNIRNQDNNYEVLARAFVAPLAPYAKDRDWMKDLWVGGSIWYERHTNLGGPVTPNITGPAQNDLPAMTTQGGFKFFPSDYSNGTDANGNPVRSHLAPNGTTFKWAVEAQIPYKRVGLRFELVQQTIALSRYDDSNTVDAKLQRSRAPGTARLEGTAFYVEPYVWLHGGQSAIGTLGQSIPARFKSYKEPPQPRWALMAAFKYEYLGFDVRGLPPAYDATRKALVDPAAGNYRVHVAEVGLNAWILKHIRVTANYVFNYFDGDAPNIKSNLYYRKGGLHELHFRLAVQL